MSPQTPTITPPGRLIDLHLVLSSRVNLARLEMAIHLFLTATPPTLLSSLLSLLPEFDKYSGTEIEQEPGFLENGDAGVIKI